MFKYILPTLVVFLLLTFSAIAQDGHEGYEHIGYDRSQHAGAGTCYHASFSK